MRTSPSILALTCVCVASLLAACATGTVVRGEVDDSSDASVDAEPVDGALPPRDAGAPDAAVDGASGPRAPAAGEVIFSELMINPDGVSDELGEWIELFNTTDAPLSLAGCRLTDESSPKDDKLVDGPVVIPAKSAIVLAREGDSAQNGGLVGAVLEYGPSFVLANGGDTAVLVCGTTEVDRVTFTSTWPFAKGTTMQLRQSARSATANDLVGSWCPATLTYGTGTQRGTPGNTQNHCP
jgi:hypothetical protein